MNKTIFTPIRTVLVLGLTAISAIQMSAQATDTIFVSDKYSVHVAFSHELRYVDVSNDSPIRADILDGYSNILSIKCSGMFLSTCSMTVLLSTGAIETFILKYREDDIDLLIDRRASPSINDTPNIDCIMELDKKFTHIGTKCDGILVLCDVI
ncbi:MAG: conjugative transposon protein TraN [Bacteroidales bacterium]|nr:conjugative transposon protein TraN [Bacteroidales bacterium]